MHITNQFTKALLDKSLMISSVWGSAFIPARFSTKPVFVESWNWYAANHNQAVLPSPSHCPDLFFHWEPNRISLYAKKQQLEIGPFLERDEFLTPKPWKRSVPTFRKSIEFPFPSHELVGAASNGLCKDQQWPLTCSHCRFKCIFGVSNKESRCSQAFNNKP